jgi:hypothetical protein
VTVGELIDRLTEWKRDRPLLVSYDCDCVRGELVDVVVADDGDEPALLLVVG